MCGIAGFFGPGAGDGRHVGDIVASMAYRGPDDRGFFTAPGVELGMCRLSIVDTAGGRQPIRNEDGSVVAVCNGEIYNHRELRAELEAKGHRLRSGSDCEVLVHLYEEEGVDFVRRLHGMFGLLLWDAGRRVLLAARDRVGIKPLYYHIGPEGAAFCSEFAPLETALGFRPDLPPRQVWSYLTFGFPALPGATMDGRVLRLEPGETLTLDADGAHRLRRYWRPRYFEPEAHADACGPEDMRGLFLETLASHLECEVPSALMLSGGLDSSCLAAYARQLGHSPLVITAGYSVEHPGDERAVARATARRLGLEMTEVVLDAEAYLNAFDELSRHVDEPVADIASVPQWQIYKRVREMGIKVLHTGIGGDEIFFGYDLWNEAVGALLRGENPRRFETDDASGLYHHPSYRASRVFLEAGVSPDIADACRGLDAEVAAGCDVAGLSGPDRVYQPLFATWLPNNCLHLADRLAMGNSLEVRVPLLDDRFVDCVQGIDPARRFQVGRGKPLLKRMMAEHFDEEFLERPKRGFTPPPNCAGTLVERHKDLILGGRLATRFFKPGWLAGKWPDAGCPDVWFRILVFEKWLENLGRPARIAG